MNVTLEAKAINAMPNLKIREKIIHERLNQLNKNSEIGVKARHNPEKRVIL